MNKQRCGECAGCDNGFWCVEWGEPNEVQLMDMSDTEFGLVTRMMKGRHGSVTDATVVADPPSRVHPSVEGSISAAELKGSGSVPVPFAEPYRDEPLPPVKGLDPRSKVQTEREFRFDVFLPVTCSDVDEDRDVERKRAEIQRALEMTLHMPHVEVTATKIVKAFDPVPRRRIQDRPQA